MMVYLGIDKYELVAENPRRVILLLPTGRYLVVDKRRVSRFRLLAALKALRYANIDMVSTFNDAMEKIK